jgi:hypothetical protein
MVLIPIRGSQKSTLRQAQRPVKSQKADALCGGSLRIQAHQAVDGISFRAIGNSSLISAAIY